MHCQNIRSECKKTEGKDTTLSIMIPDPASSTEATEKSAVDATGLPTLVSFYAGDKYYYDAADALRRDCERLGIPHHIEEISAEGLDWGQICRIKIDFYRRMHKRYGAIFWVDVDTRLMHLPEVLRNCAFDMAGFGGRYRYIRDYDPHTIARFWVPSFLFFGGSDAAGRFIELMARIDSEANCSVTDDWVLHEAWIRHDEQLSIGFLPPNMVNRSGNLVEPHHILVFGDSGNVKSFRSQVVQHERKLDQPGIRSMVLGAESVDAMKAGDRQTALLLTRRAAAINPADEESIIRLSRYLKISGERIEAGAVLEENLRQYPRNYGVREELVKRFVELKDFGQAEEQLDHLRNSPDLKIAARAASIAYEVSLDKRAKEAGIADKQRPQMWWMKTPYPGNFGDILSPWVVEHVGGVPPRFGQREAGLLAIGSIIKFATGRSTVWGSGTPRLGDALSADARYLAVRGPITRSEVLASGGNCPEVYGDPGLLLPRFIPHPSRKPRYRLGFIRHVNHNACPLEFDGVLDIRLSGVGEEFLHHVVAQITDCERIISTSLHGVIVSHAYGIPARWAEFGDDAGRLAGDGTKFEDYFLSVKVPVQTPLDLSGVTTLDESLARHVDSSVDITFDGDRLINAYLEK